MKESKKYSYRIVKRTYEDKEQEFIIQCKFIKNDESFWSDSVLFPNHKSLEDAEYWVNKFIKIDNDRYRKIISDEII